MEWPEFTLKNFPRVVALIHGPEEPAQGHGGRSARADSSQSGTLRDSGIAEWASYHGRCADQREFGQKLAGRQVEAELNSIFRATPEFGRPLALRIADFHDSRSTGSLTLLGGGGEAVVFFDSERQEVVKLLGTSGKAAFGWCISQDSESRRTLFPGSMSKSLNRFLLAEEYFPTGLDISLIGKNSDFMVLTQPFLLGENPKPDILSAYMHNSGWEPFSPPSELVMIKTQTWKKGRIIATDVRPENAILAECDDEIYPFDFIVCDDSTPCLP